jgi:hypothetical protein
MILLVVLVCFFALLPGACAFAGGPRVECGHGPAPVAGGALRLEASATPRLPRRFRARTPAVPAFDRIAPPTVPRIARGATGPP